MGKMKISQTDAAQRQVCEGIRLLFEERDPVAVHTLVGAAQGILRDLLQKQGKGSLLKDHPLIRQEKRKQWITIVNSFQDFFKHARNQRQQ